MLCKISIGSILKVQINSEAVDNAEAALSKVSIDETESPMEISVTAVNPTYIYYRLWRSKPKTFQNHPLSLQALFDT